MEEALLLPSGNSESGMGVARQNQRMTVPDGTRAGEHRGGEGRPD